MKSKPHQEENINSSLLKHLTGHIMSCAFQSERSGLVFRLGVATGSIWSIQIRSRASVLCAWYVSISEIGSDCLIFLSTRDDTSNENNVSKPLRFPDRRDYIASVGVTSIWSSYYQPTVNFYEGLSYWSILTDAVWREWFAQQCESWTRSIPLSRCINNEGWKLFCVERQQPLEDLMTWVIWFEETYIYPHIIRCKAISSHKWRPSSQMTETTLFTPFESAYWEPCGKKG